MNPQLQKTTIARACGWEWIIESTQGRYQGIRPENTKRYCNWHRPAPAIDVDDARTWHWLPDYLNDLNPCAEMEKTLDAVQLEEYRRQLACFFTDHPDDGIRFAIHATAAQRCEAFLKVKGLWEGED